MAVNYATDRAIQPEFNLSAQTAAGVHHSNPGMSKVELAIRGRSIQPDFA